MTSHVIAYQSLELLFGTHTFHFNCFLEDFNCVFTQIRCLSRVLYVQWTIPSLLFQTRRTNLLVYKGLTRNSVCETLVLKITNIGLISAGRVVVDQTVIFKLLLSSHIQVIGASFG